MLDILCRSCLYYTIPYINLFSGMPTTPYLYANDLINVLKKKHASGTYKSMVNNVKLSVNWCPNLCKPDDIIVIFRYFTLKRVNLEVFLKVFSLKAWIYTQLLQQMRKRVAGERTVRVIFLVLPLNLKPVWVICIALLGWRTGIRVLWLLLLVCLWPGFCYGCLKLSKLKITFAK